LPTRQRRPRRNLSILQQFAPRPFAFAVRILMIGLVPVNKVARH
jgi:hypothetical protein